MILLFTERRKYIVLVRGSIWEELGRGKHNKKTLCEKNLN